MEKKTTQRIIGILVVSALVIILLPLLFGKNEFITQASTVNAPPPLPDASVNQQRVENNSIVADSFTVDTNQQISSVAQSDSNPNGAEAAPSLAEAKKSVNAQTEITASTVNGKDEKSDATAQISITKADNQVDQIVKTVDPVEKSTDQTDNKITATPEVATTDNSTAKPEDVKTEVVIPTEENSGNPAETKSTAENTTAPDQVKTKPALADAANVSSTALSQHKSSIKFKTSGWVVQMGSFKQKSNAKRLTEKLRSAGFKVFMRETHSSTKVYLGPETKQASAMSLSNHAAEKFNMKGIVMKWGASS